MKAVLTRKEYLQSLWRVAVPVTFQNLLSSSLNLVDTMMVGAVGTAALASVGLANQLFFIMILLVFGVNSGVSVFIAQFWGKKDVTNIKRTMGIGLTLSVSVSVIFWAIGLFFPEEVMSLLGNGDKELIVQGGLYLKIIAWSYLFTGVSFAFSVAARSIEQVKVPTIISAIAVFINIGLNYILIFGKFGMPALGIEGAAYATLIARAFEMIFIVVYVYVVRSPLSGTLKAYFDYDFDYFKRVMKTSLPVIINESMWAVGNVFYTIAVARISPEAVAAFQIGVSIYRFYEVAFIGLASSCQVMIGNAIGRGENEKAKKAAFYSLVISQTAAIVIGAGLFLSASWNVGFFDQPLPVTNDAVQIVQVYAFYTFFKVFNLMMIVGVLRGGGDTQFAMIIELTSVWLIGVPLAFLGAVVLKVSVVVTVAMLVFEEVVKFFCGLYRYKSKKWIHNLTGDLKLSEE